jgi:2-dehydropantoate 2-reductase
MPELRVVVVGAGAIGGWLAARLGLCGVDVGLLARGASLQRVREQGLVLEEGGQTQQLRLRVSDDPQELGRHDLVVLAVKGQQLAGAAPQVAALLAPEGKVLTAMNGVPWWFFDDRPVQAVDPGGAVHRLLPPERVLGAVVHASCQAPQPGCIRHVMGQGWLIGDPAQPGSEAERAAVDLLCRAGFEAQPSADIRAALWYKLWGNATTNPISALCGVTTDRILDDALVCRFTDACMHELAAIGARVGCPVAQTPADRHAITRRLGAFKTSMLQDREAGRSLELDALLAAPREIAQQVGVPTPMLDALHGLARLIQTRSTAPDPTPAAQS